MEITTQTGQKFFVDLALPGDNPERLYLNFPKGNVAEIAAVFTNEDNLPLLEFPRYREFCSLGITQFGDVKVCLK